MLPRTPRLSSAHLVAAGALFVVEVLIAVFVADGFVRPYVGDVLAVMLMHCTIRAVIDVPPGLTAAAVLAFSYALEVAQWAGIGRLVDGHPILLLVVGSTFQWGDLVAYAVGALLCLLGERAWPRLPGSTLATPATSSHQTQ